MSVTATPSAESEPRRAPAKPALTRGGIDQIVRFELIRQHLPAPPAHVFEVGFGGGQLLRWLAGHGYRVSGCEMNADQVERLRREPIEGVDEVLQANGAELPVPNESQDCVLSSDVFEHVLPEERDAFLAEKLRITKPGGWIVMTVWLHDTWSFRMYGAVQLMCARMLPQWYIEHLQIPHPKFEPIRAFFDAHCTDVSHRHYQGALNVAAMTLQHLAGHKRKRRLQRWLGCLRPVAQHGDWLGRRTSCLFVGRKREAD